MILRLIPIKFETLKPPTAHAPHAHGIKPDTYQTTWVRLLGLAV
jgi:hypothetical protein